MSIMDLLREVVADLSDYDRDVHQIARMMESRTRSADLRLFYCEALLVFVRAHLGRLGDVGEEDGPTAQIRVDDHTPPGGRSSPPPGGNVGNSRVAWLRRMGLRENVYVGPNTYRRIDLCGVVELRAAAAALRRQADGYVLAAHRYSVLEHLLVKHGCATVGDLPDTVLKDSFK